MLHRRFVRQGKTYLLWGLLGFVTVQLGLGLLIDQALPDVRDPTHAQRLRSLQALRVQDPEAPLVLALGSSRMWLGLQAARLHPSVNGRPAQVYNLARSAAGPVVMMLTLQRLLADKVRPDRVLVELSPLFFNQRNGRLWDEKRLDGAELQLPELVQACRYAKEPWIMVGTWSLGRGLPCYRHGVELARELPLEYARGATAVDPNHGWVPVRSAVTAEERKLYTGIALGQYEDALVNFRLAPQAVRALRGLLDLCRKNGIEAVLVMPPEGTGFRGLYDPAALPVIDAFVLDLRREWGIPVIDARNWMADMDFWDMHHLLPEGARAFTDRLGLALEATWTGPPRTLAAVP